VKTASRIIGLSILLGLGWLGWQHFFPNEEQRIRRMLESLAETVSIPARPSVIGAARAVDQLLSCVTPDIEVTMDVLGEGRHTFSGREEIREAALVAHRNLGGLKVRFLDVSVALAADKQTATAELTVEATQSGAKNFFVQEMKLFLRQEAQQWRVSRAETVKVLRQ